MQNKGNRNYINLSELKDYLGKKVIIVLKGKEGYAEKDNGIAAYWDLLQNEVELVGIDNEKNELKFKVTDKLHTLNIFKVHSIFLAELK